MGNSNLQQLLVAVDKVSQARPDVRRLRAEHKAQLVWAGVVGQALGLRRIGVAVEDIAASPIPDKTGIPASRIHDIAHAVAVTPPTLDEILDILDALGCEMMVEVAKIDAPGSEHNPMNLRNL